MEAISVSVKKYSKIPAESEFVFAIGKIHSGPRPTILKRKNFELLATSVLYEYS